jgi:tetratricopeptide (TPR) repeat protein
MRIGIHTGLVVFGSVGGNLRMDPTAIGDAANVAARLQTSAEVGTILISEETSRLAQGYAQVEPVGLLTLKGKAEPFAAYRLLGVSHRLAADRASAAARPLVGRRSELAALGGLVASVAEGHGQLIGIVGEPGIGKSRLLHEFRNRLAGGMTWVEGRCLSYGTMTPYLLVLDLLRGICGILETDNTEAITARLRATLAEIGMNPDQDSALLLHLLGIENLGEVPALPSPEAIKTKAFETLRQLIIGASRRRPLSLALEDLHWIDKVSEEFLAFLGEIAGRSRILLLATYRPGYRPPWIDKSYAGQVPLKPLSRAESLDLVRSLPGRLDQPVTEAIVSKADGNPFFLEQFAFDADEATGARPAEMVPNTIRDVVMARIDRLSSDAKRLLQTASVIGREFSLRLLRVVWQGSEPIEPHLRELIRLEFIFERFDNERTGYVFRHALTRETAYASLLKRYRTTLHAVVGTAIEEFYGERTDEVAEPLAFHFGRSNEADKAVDYAILAAEKAQRRWANGEALAYFDDVLSRLEAMPDTGANRVRRIDGVLKQAEVKFALGEHTKHIAALEGISEIVQEANDPRRSATWHYWTGFLHSLTGSRSEVAIEHCREAAAIASRAGLDEITGFATSSLAMVYVFAGRPQDAIECGERALAIFEPSGNLWWAGRTLWHLTLAANALGDWDRSLDYCRRALDHGTTLNEPRLKAIASWRMGSAYIQRGDLEEGLGWCDKALSLAPIPYDAANARAVRGYGLVKAGQIDAGIAELAGAVDWFENSHLRQPSLRWALWLAEGHLRRGDHTSARSLVDDILNESREAGYLHLEALACWLTGECLSPDAPEKAEGYVETALRMFAEIGARNDLAMALVSQAVLRKRAGDMLMARQLLNQAGEIFTTLGTRGEPARVETALAQLDGAPPAPGERQNRVAGDRLPAEHWIGKAARDPQVRLSQRARKCR